MELYKTWMGDHMENSAVVGIDQGLMGKPLVNTRPQVLGVFVFNIFWASWKFISRPDLLSLGTVQQAVKGGGWALGHFRGDAWRDLNLCLQLPSFDGSETF